MRSISSLNLLNLGYHNHHEVDRIRIRVKLCSENMFDHAPQIAQLFALWRRGGGPQWLDGIRKAPDCIPEVTGSPMFGGRC